MMNKSQERIILRVSINPVSGCWEWKGTKDNRRYGKICIRENGKNKTYRANRFSYEAFIGPIPEGLFVCHRCDNPSCVNPEHLFLGTNSDNIRDCVRKGRYYRHTGEKNENSKLTRKAVIEIRQKRAFNGTKYKDLAKEYGVSDWAIRSAVHGMTWKEVKYFPSVSEIRRN